MSVHSERKQVTLSSLKKMKEQGEKFTCLTSYESTLTSYICNAGVDVILVGDSLGMVIQGHDSTLPVSMEQLIYHLECVVKGNKGAHIMADMPFMSYATDDMDQEKGTTYRTLKTTIKNLGTKISTSRFLYIPLKN